MRMYISDNWIYYTLFVKRVPGAEMTRWRDIKALLHTVDLTQGIYSSPELIPFFWKSRMNGISAGDSYFSVQIWMPRHWMPPPSFWEQAIAAAEAATAAAAAAVACHAAGGCLKGSCCRVAWRPSTSVNEFWLISFSWKITEILIEDFFRRNSKYSKKKRFVLNWKCQYSGIKEIFNAW